MKNLETTSLSAGYLTRKGEKRILEGLDLGLEKGQLVCLLGINGSGKSTLLRTLGGFQEPLGGSVSIRGKFLEQTGTRDRAKLLSVVLTHNQISGMMTVREVVSLGRYPYTNWLATMGSRDHEMVDEALTLTGMASEADSYFDQLSDGQQQKVIISRAVAQDTPIIILDEPTNHLDIGNKAEILQLLQSLAHDKGKSILVSTHDLDFALQMADVLWVIKKEKVFTGPPEQVLMDGILEEAFPYSGIDLFSGKVIKRATGPESYVEGSGRSAEVTRSALRRLGFRLTTKRNDASLVVSVTETNSWHLHHDGKKLYLDTMEKLLEELKRLLLEGTITQ